VTEDALRPDNLELLRQAGRNLRSRGKIPVVFGGLRDERGIRVTTTSGAATPRLTTIRVRPDVGLGGRSWSSGQPQVVTDYARADITHDFDPQILGEGITSLAVAPIIVRDRVAGLLYAGYRAEPRRRGDLDLLWEQAQTVARELLVRDRVDERMRAMRAQSTFAAPGAAPAQAGHSELFARLRQIAARTTDRRTAAELRELLEPAAADDGTGCPLTARQVDVLALVALGMTNDSIGASLGLSALTVKSYLRAAMTRLGAQTRYEAVIEARRRGLLP
jgi:DNA-binding CsgD family transcriptional regulator